jgi:phage shock protein A
MKETMTGRVARIISGGFNALLDAVENRAPEAAMEQALREIDEAIGEVRTELGKVMASKHLASSRLMQVNAKCEDLGEKIELAVAENRDDLAAAAISQQLDIEAQIPILETQIADLSNTEKELEGYIAALKGKKGEMREDLRLFKASRNTAEHNIDNAASGKGVTVADKVNKAESAFNRILENSTGAGATPGTIDRENAAAMNELEDLARKNRVQERLAAIKRKRGTVND